MKKRTIRVVAGAAVLGALIAGAVRLASHGSGGLPAVGQVISAGQRPPGPDISGTSLTGQRLDVGPVARQRRGGQLLGIVVRPVPRGGGVAGPGRP